MGTTKYIFVPGAVVSSVGKGITTAAIGRILKSPNISVVVQKLDPYLNVDPGTMSPYQHGEVFVTNESKERIRGIGRASGAEVVIVEVGGTVGDIESQPHLEAIRQMRNEESHSATLSIHVTLLPYISTTAERKTAPTQHSVP